VSVLHEAIRHHVWATEQLLDVCATVPEPELERVAPGTYGSALDTLRHIVDADASYLFVISGGDLGSWDIDADGLSFAEVRDAAEANARDYEILLERDLDTDANLVRVRDDGSERHATIGVRLAQVAHHGSDHRSQVCTALTALGHEPPEFDVWAWGEAVGLSHEVPPPGD
jgi:uncharacterized damage-inducible protein DinB